MHSFLLIGAHLALVSLFSGSVKATACNTTTPCLASAPCCSEFGFCGTDNFCLGGCNPFASHTLNSCRPSPVCEDVTHTFADNSRILSNATYFEGNASDYDFVVDKGNIMNTNSSGGELALLLTKDNGGTRISSTRYLQYGTITARLKTGRWAGVVTAFITMSDIKDEIDWEFPGANITEGQSNYFWQGNIPEGTNNGETAKGLTDTYSDYHDYTLDWQPDNITWFYDGNVVRTLKRSDVALSSSGRSRYPSTPSRIQISLWPAGIPGTAPGTVQWAGGMINWDDPDYKSAGHFFALLKSVTIKCAEQTPLDIISYVYDANATSSSPNVALSNRTTLLNGSLSNAVASPHGMIVALLAALFLALPGF